MENSSTLQALFSNEVFTTEFGHLQGTCYLDHTGSALYAKSQVEAFARDLCENVYPNPHSNTLLSQQCGNMVDQVRNRILQHFNTTTNDYSVIFTSGATAALKMVAEHFDFGVKCCSPKDKHDDDQCGTFMYVQENHTSVLGMRNVDNIRCNRVAVKCVSQSEASQILKPDIQSSSGDQHEQDCTKSLFVYPAQCNFSGLKYPLVWVEKVQKGMLEDTLASKSRCEWYCLLDAATYVSTNQLDLKRVQPDFVAISFYKMWGLPTGLGALLVRKSSANVLKKRYFGGGTINVALASKQVQVFRPELHERYEDGTINFLSICALRHALDWQTRSGLSMRSVSLHCFALAQYTYHSLRQLLHSNGLSAVQIYADTQFDDPDTQGGIVNFNLLTESSHFIGYSQVLRMAELYGIQLRVGCFCNPGACQRHLGITEEHYFQNYQAGHVCGDDIDLINGHPTGSLRVSFGPYSRQKDCDTLIDMISKCFVTKTSLDKELHEKCVLKEDIKDIQNAMPQLNPTCETDYVPTSSSTILRQPPIVVSRICLYPVKSCGAFEVSCWPLDQRGLLYDRNWMVVTEAGITVTQKQDPHLCLIKPVVDLTLKRLILKFSGQPSCTIPLDQPSSHVIETWLCQSKICGDYVSALDCGNSVADWLNLVLERSDLRLLQQSSSNNRSPKTEDNGKTDSFLALSNQAQFLLVNENSVRWLLDRLPDHSDCSKAALNTMVDRFRCNFVVKGQCPAFDEQKWKEAHISSQKFIVDGLCGRCQMICIDQRNGKKSNEPLTTLAAISKGRIKFGIYLSYQNYTKSSYISVGDEVVTYVQ